MTTKPGVIASALVGILLLAFAVSVDFPKANGGRFKGDESTYYMLGHSLARDFDFQYERKDLDPRVGGIFRARGRVPEDGQGRRNPRLELVSVLSLGRSGKIPSARRGCISRSPTSIR